MSDNSLQIQASETKHKTLPKGWEWATLGEIHLDKGTSIVPSETPEDMFELYSVPSFDTGRPEIVAGREIGSNKRIVEEGAVLLCKINPHINRVWVVGNHSPWRKISSTEWIPFFRLKGIEPRYLLYFMQNYDFRTFLSMNVSGVGGSLMRVRLSSLDHYSIPLPPTKEQERIVVKLEELFTKLDAGIASLKKAKLQLKQYRQSILKYAFEGKLTEKWRESQRIEHASNLMELIKKEKEKSHTKIEKASIEPKILPEIPKQWMWVMMEDVLVDARYGTSKKCNYQQANTAVLRIPNIVDGTVDLQDLKYTNLTDRELNQLKLEAGDILVIRTNGSRDLVGKSAIFEKTEGIFAFASYLIRLRVALADRIARYINLYLQSQLPIDFIQRNARTTAGQYNVNLGILSSIPIPMPSLEEQLKTIKEIERLLSIADNLESSIEQSIEQSYPLRQSILRSAFHGKLTHQNPSEEPATMLLQKIRAEKAKDLQDNDVSMRTRAKLKEEWKQTRLV